ncbi:Aste57867_15800 [Aphanomyces stellatus]|uniref:Aste57867_15800 protein n=1 Tax=Aphanomyces stellatus TaxID=120398 RepID=A0A485L3Z2_9STRA|nr:hypothetical protein As57867_015744 [Aphanomyces stellatus]VFT92588.1 Aste57867_15800 [Aphanomyces stellatus]
MKSSMTVIFEFLVECGHPMSTSTPLFTHVHLTADAAQRLNQTQLRRLHEAFPEDESPDDSWKVVSVHFDDKTKDFVFENSISVVFNVPFDILAHAVEDTVHDIRVYPSS